MGARKQTYLEMGYRPTQAQYLDDTVWFFNTDTRKAEMIIEIHQHPLVSRMLIVTTDRGQYKFVKTAQVWVR